MAELKTKRTDASAEKFIKGIKDEGARADCLQILEIMKKVTRAEPKMWGTSIVGFGDYQYKYKTGREGDWFKVGFSPRKQNLTIYLMGGFDGQEELLGNLGKHTTGKGCLYIKRMEDIDAKILKDLVAQSVKRLKQSKS
jgi:hypothetical protein